MTHTPHDFTYEMDKYSGKNWLVAVVDFGTQPNGENKTAFICTDHVNASMLGYGEPEADMKRLVEAWNNYDALRAKNERLTRRLGDECRARDEAERQARKHSINLFIAVMHLESILGQHTEASETLTAAERWLMSRK